jgi:hypothetical protein
MGCCNTSRFGVTRFENKKEVYHFFANELEPMKFQCMKWYASNFMTRAAVIYDHRRDCIIFSVGIGDQQIELTKMGSDPISCDQK